MLNQIILGDCREILKTLPDNSVNCCVTSPPYFGLRDYGTAEWEVGEIDCKHNIGGRQQVPQTKHKAAAVSIVAGGNRGAGKTCLICGSVRVDGQIGLEETPAEYIETLLEVFKEVKRVLRPDGTVWLNLGDSYAAGKAGRTDYGTGDLTSTLGPKENGLPNNSRPGPVIQRKAPKGYKPKQLLGIPWRVAFALQDDGWFLRSDIIWHKPNPMPESVTDRPTKAHEYIFLLTKSSKYYYDADAIREQNADPNRKRFSAGKRVASDEYKEATGDKHRGFKNLEDMPGAGRNKRTVWTIPSQPYSGSHFATFPEKLIEPCVLAGCPVGGVILDPFGGSGTVARVANRHSRNSILIELNPEYLKLIDQRTDKVQVRMAI
jgi:DNA modification methylase